MRFQNREDDFERRDMERLERAYRKFVSQGDSSSQPASFEEDEYAFIIDQSLAAGEDALAEKAAKQAYKQHPYSPIIISKIAEYYLISIGPKKALAFLLEHDMPFEPEVELMLCRVYIAMKQYEKAKDRFCDIVKNTYNIEDYCDIVHTLAHECIVNEEFKEALYYLDESTKMADAWNKKNETEEDPETIKLYLFDYAFVYQNLENWAGAIFYYEKYLEFNPFDDKAWFNLANAYWQQNNLEKVIECNEYSYALNNENTNALFNLGIVSISLNKIDDAINYFTKYTKAEKTDSAGMVGLGNAYMLKGNLIEAEILLRKALIFNPASKEAQRSLEILQKRKHAKKRPNSNSLSREQKRKSNGRTKSSGEERVGKSGSEKSREKGCAKGRKENRSEQGNSGTSGRQDKGNGQDKGANNSTE